MAQDLVGLGVGQYGLKRFIRKLDPRHVEEAMGRALDRGAEYLLYVIQGQSRIGKTGRYLTAWHVIPTREGRAVVNDEPYAEFVTGNTMATTLRGGRRRGAVRAFMHKISREESMNVRRMLQEELRREFSR